MSRARRACALLALVLAASTLAAPTAEASTVSVSDKQDMPKSRLDIKSVSLVRLSNGDLKYQFTTYKGFSKYVLNPGYHTYFVVFFDTDGDFSYPERFLFIFESGSRIIGLMTNSAGHKVAYTKAAKPGAASVSATFSPTLLSDPAPAEYWWQGASYDGARPAQCKRPCGDGAPNRAVVPQDLAAPTVSIPSVPDPTTDQSATTTFTVGLDASDTGGSGLESWAVKTRPLGTTTWSTAATGDGSSLNAEITGQEGQTYEVCATALDGAGNSGASTTRRVTLPADDAGSLAGDFSGMWTTLTDDTDNFLGTLHTDATPGDTFVIQVPPASNVAWIAPGGFDGAANVMVTGSGAPPSSTEVSMTSVSGHRQKIWTANFQNDGITRTVTITVEAGTVALDAFWTESFLTGPPPPPWATVTCG